MKSAEYFFFKVAKCDISKFAPKEYKNSQDSVEKSVHWHRLQRYMCKPEFIKINETDNLGN